MLVLLKLGLVHHVVVAEFLVSHVRELVETLSVGLVWIAVVFDDRLEGLCELSNSL